MARKRSIEARYAELHCRTAFSFLDGGSSPQEIVERARALDLPALAITDKNGLYGIVEAREVLLEACGIGRGEEGRAPLRLLYGSEISFESDVAVALVQNRDGYANLCRIIAGGRLKAEKGAFELSLLELLARPGGLILLAGGPRSLAMRHLCAGERRAAVARLEQLHEAFGDRLHIELVRHQAPGDDERSRAMATLARELGLPVVATNDVHFHERSRKPFHDLLRCIDGGFSLAEAGRRLLPNTEAHLKPAAEMETLFADCPEALARTLAIARSIEFRLCDVTYTYPPPDLPPGEDADSFLRRLCHAGLGQRLGATSARYTAQLDKELALIAELRYAGYFLTMWEVVNVCRERNILCQGRGSAANSLVCFALGITSVRPDTIDMLFERFLSRERNEPPDIDLDIEHERREEIIQHVYKKYDRDHAGMVAEVIRYRWRSAVRDVGKALGFPEAQILRLSKFLSHDFAELDAEALRTAGMDSANPKVQLLLRYAQALVGVPRHSSIHVGGFVLSDEPLSTIVPIENGRMADRTVIQWSKDDVDAMGMFKLDLLGLGMLTALAKVFALVHESRGVRFGLETVPPDDPATYDMLRRGDTVGVFQVESRAQMNMLQRLKPESFYDLVIEVAIVRPGPIEGKMVHPFLRRRRGVEAPDYPHEKLRPILERTLGVPLFQEQVMRLAEAVGGYTPGEADQLRRDMGSWRATGKMQRHRERLIAGMLENGLSPEFAERVFEQIEGFGSYGFPESHAAAFAHLAYVSAYMKRHFPTEFACALLNAQPMGFYSPAVLVNDLKRHGGRVLPVDAQRSQWDCTLEDGASRLGLRLVRGLGERAARALVRARYERPFRSVADLAQRAELPPRALLSLAAAGALVGFHARRRTAIWETAAVGRPRGELLGGIDEHEPVPALPPLTTAEEMALDAAYTGTFPGKHPMELVRPELTRLGVLRACDLAEADPQRRAAVAGLVITRQRPGTAKGAVFVTLEDETGQLDVAFSAEAFQRMQSVVRLSGALLVRGRITADGTARNIAAETARPLSIDAAVSIPSHDFH